MMFVNVPTHARPKVNAIISYLVMETSGDNVGGSILIVEVVLKAGSKINTIFMKC